MKLNSKNKNLRTTKAWGFVCTGSGRHKLSVRSLQKTKRESSNYSTMVEGYPVKVILNWEIKKKK